MSDPFIYRKISGKDGVVLITHFLNEFIQKSGICENGVGKSIENARFLRDFISISEHKKE